MGRSPIFETSDLSDVLRESVERAQAELSQACASGLSQQTRQAAVVGLEQAVKRLNDYILRFILTADVNR